MKKNLKLLTVFITLLFVFTACKHSNNDHLSPKIMKRILLDMHIAEAYSTMAKDSLHRLGVKNYDSLAAWYKDIFVHYKLTPQQFTESLNWYKNHPADIDSIYTDMLPVITKWQSKATEHKPN
jgi:hypothetical protein